LSTPGGEEKDADQTKAKRVSRTRGESQRKKGANTVAHKGTFLAVKGEKKKKKTTQTNKRKMKENHWTDTREIKTGTHHAQKIRPNDTVMEN